MIGRGKEAQYTDYGLVKISDAIDDEGKIKTSEDEKTLVFIKELEDKFEASKKFMEGIHKRWKTNMSLYRNKFEMNVPLGSTKMRFDIPLAVIETQMPIIADNLPTFYIKPEEEDDKYFSEMMHYFERIWY